MQGAPTADEKKLRAAAVEPTVAYVVNRLDNNVAVVNAGVDRVLARIPVGRGPRDLAVSPDNTLVDVANRTGNSVSVIDTTTRKVTATVAVGTSP
ncbi:YncE family protein [Streptomyces anulatus]|uniref:YncE family protein n=1 Tax=Streptomyces anulatus TaxID=1892 RepID=UPI003866106D|nr:beta-propeller fold lactonase family protein [Streptomyces anulatus]